MATETAPVNVVNADIIGAAIAKGIADGLKATAPPRKIEFGEFNGKSPFDKKANSSGFYGPNEKPVLERASFQNGIRFREEYLTDVEIGLLNQVVRPGRYIERMVEVVIWDDGSEKAMDLRYKNKTPDQRSELKSEAKSLLVMLKRIVEEQDEAELDQDTAPRKHKRT
jgi:hypothetical protein